MATEYSGGGDPKRSLELLWRSREPSGRRGPKPKLTVDGIVRAAIGVADEEGLSALSMRRVAERLGVTAMSLYTYVPGKAELIDVVLDTVCGDMARTEPRSDHWRARVEAVAEDNRALYERHPWLASVVSASRPPLGPGLIGKYEYELRAFDGTGLDDVERDAALAFLLSFVGSCARAAAEAKASRQLGAMSDLEWWTANAPLLERVFDAEKYPTAARVGAAAGEAHQAAFDSGHAYAFGLQRVLDGLGVLIEARAGERRERAGEAGEERQARAEGEGR